MPDLPPFPNPGFVKPNPFRPVSEGPPRFDFAWHPAATLCKVQSPDKEDFRQLYLMIFDREPPATIEEWEARKAENAKRSADWRKKMGLD